MRALASHQCGSGSNPSVDAICGLSLLLVLSLAPRGFSPGTPVFPSPQKPTFPNSNLIRNQVDEEPLCGCATSKSLFIYLFYYFTCLFRPQRPQNRISNCRQNHYHNGRPMFIKIAFRPWCFYLKTLLSASSWSIGSTHECHPSIFYSFQYLTDFPGWVYFHPN